MKPVPTFIKHDFVTLSSATSSWRTSGIISRKPNQAVYSPKQAVYSPNQAVYSSCLFTESSRLFTDSNRLFSPNQAVYSLNQAVNSSRIKPSICRDLIISDEVLAHFRDHAQEALRPANEGAVSRSCKVISAHEPEVRQDDRAKPPLYSIQLDSRAFIQ